MRSRSGYNFMQVVCDAVGCAVGVCVSFGDLATGVFVKGGSSNTLLSPVFVAFFFL